MREIKFRAWNKKDKEMWDSTAYVPNIMFSGDIVDDDGYKIEDLVLMQYTGLKDKNGKEIYEGDIVKEFYPEDVKADDDGIGIGEIRYIDGLGGFKIEDEINNNTWDLFDAEDTKSIEVIGNIYENPELLK